MPDLALEILPPRVFVERIAEGLPFKLERHGPLVAGTIVESA